MSTKKLLKEIDPKEAVESFVFPVKLTASQKRKAAEELSIARKALQKKTTEEVRLIAGLMQLKFKLEDYIQSENYDPNKRFGFFLREYLTIIGRKLNEFAEEIKVHKTLMSQVINNSREPNDKFIVRLELHSNNNIPAEYWFKLVQKEHIYQLQTNKELRIRERRYITNKVQVKINTIERISRASVNK